MHVGVRHPRDAFEHLQVPDRQMIAVGRRRQVAGQDGRQRMRMDDAPRATASVRETEDRVAFARAEVVPLGFAGDVAVTRIDCEELVGPDALLVHAARCQEQTTIA